MRKIILFLACLAVSAPAFAQVTCYAVTPSTSGSGTGASWTNAHGGFPTLVRGTRYYVADGAYTSSPSLGTAVSGTTIIELRKAQSYDFGRTSDGCSNDISAGWNPSTMGSAQAVWTTAWSIGTSYLTINGNGTSTGPGCGGAYGSNIAVGTVTGSPDCGFVIDNTSGGIGTTRPMGFSGNNNTVEYFEIRQDGNNNSNFTIFGTGSGSSGNPNIFSHLYLHYAGCVFLQDLGNYVTVDQSYFWGTEVNGGSSCHGQAEFEVGSTSHGTRTNSVYRDISGTAVWTWAATTGTGTNMLWYNNIVFYSPYGNVTATTGASGSCPANCLLSTSGDNVGSSFSAGQTIYLGGSTPGASTANTVSTIYSPTLLSLTTTPSTTGATHFYSVNFGGLSDAVWDCINGDTCNNWEMDQNTVVNCHPGGAQVSNSCGNVGAVYYDSGSGGNGNFNFRNNLAYNITGSYSFSQAGSTFTANTDHNSYLNSPTPSCSSCTNVGGDVHVASGAANPFVAWPSNAANFALASDNANYNNRTTGSLIPPADITGTTFTTDRGAYQFTSGGTAIAPSCSPGTGTYTSTQTVTCTNPNSGTTVMCYSTSTTPVTNGSGTSCTTGTQYTTTISVSATETLNIVAGTSLLSDSSVVSYTYTISTQAATPTLTPGTGTYDNNQTVTLSTISTGTVIICWATGATTPVTNGAGTGCSTGTSAANNSTITVSASETVNAVAGTSTTTDSAEASATYALVVGTPSFSPPAGAYSVAQSVTISTSTSGTTLHYAVNATPTCASTVYSGPVTVSASETLEAIGCLSGYTNSSVGSAVYSIGGIVPISGACSVAVTAQGASPTWSASCTPTLAGDAIPIFVQCHPTSGTITAITLTATGYTVGGTGFGSINQMVSPISTGSNSWGALYGVIALNTSPVTFNVGFTGASNCSNFAIFLSQEFSGNSTVGGATTFNATGSSSGAASTCNQTAANVTPPLNNEAIFNACLLGSATTATSPWTLGVTDGNGNSAEYQILSGGAGGAQTPAFNGSSGAYIVEGTAITPSVIPHAPTALTGVVTRGAVIQ